jgi:hypothetical protein
MSYLEVSTWKNPEAFRMRNKISGLLIKRSACPAQLKIDLGAKVVSVS